MTLLDHANAQVARLAGELDAEEAKIAAAIAAKAIGDGSGYWKRAHALRERHLGCVTKRHLIWETHAENMKRQAGRPKGRRPFEVEVR